MRNKKLGRFLALATAVTVLTTTVLPQGAVYASEPETSSETVIEESTEESTEDEIAEVAVEDEAARRERKRFRKSGTLL